MKVENYLKSETVMQAIPLSVNGAFLVELEPFQDERGAFVRSFCKKELASLGLDFDIKQCNISTNVKKNTLRGMHYQRDPRPEIKIVSCLRGRIFDVLLDLRKDSSTYLKWCSLELSGDSHCLVYIPPMVAHGFQTLEENSLVYYQLSEFFTPELYEGVRYNDPAFQIQWPLSDPIISKKDASYPLYQA